ncbi:uncharacterized protein F4822DRAFT_433486 [Hypoxylon trugodes]|uniref:uncharacterized protein n=1 Tax=Hypoxylon trugodes TaxID=326681 RepID=UPI0021937D24|nr:uncharacterized protein F4822DRAFT_433486 [Hypoxylon trugodes]KAI1384950.1 hypothetical protein F4822DRAFT_433486 [Hypoxylon trugodes]
MASSSRQSLSGGVLMGAVCTPDAHPDKMPRVQASPSMLRRYLAQAPSASGELVLRDKQAFERHKEAISAQIQYTEIILLGRTKKRT